MVSNGQALTTTQTIMENTISMRTTIVFGINTTAFQTITFQQPIISLIQSSEIAGLIYATWTYRMDTTITRSNHVGFLFVSSSSCFGVRSTSTFCPTYNVYFLFQINLCVSSSKASPTMNYKEFHAIFCEKYSLVLVLKETNLRLEYDA